MKVKNMIVDGSGMVESARTSPDTRRALCIPTRQQRGQDGEAPQGHHISGPMGLLHHPPSIED